MVLVTTVVPALLLAVLAAGILVGQSQSRGRITTIFQSRGQATEAFVASFVANEARQERVIGEANLATTTVDQQDFSDDDVAFGFPAAVLVDRTGRALAVYPAAPTLLGTDLASRYAHLRTGIEGRIGVSDVVPSAARGEPVIAIASPFATPFGRRVYSGAFAVASTPLGIYLSNSIVAPQHQVYLIDATGQLISSSPVSHHLTLSTTSPALAQAMKSGSFGTFDRKGTWTYLTIPVAGTPWRLVFAEANGALFRSVSGFASVAPWLIFVVLAIVAGLLTAVFLRSVRDRRILGDLSQRMTQAAETDELTGLANRRQLVRIMESMTRGRRASDEGITVMILDLDKFKSINDTYGHDAGDRALQLIASVMKKVFRETDSFGRWGGDEFVAVLTNLSSSNMAIVVERLQNSIGDVALRVGSEWVQLHISIGVAATSGTHEQVEMDELLRRADVALYEAKAGGGGAAVWNASVDAAVSGPLKGNRMFQVLED